MSLVQKMLQKVAESPITRSLLHGQWISILIAGTGVFASLLSATHPTTNFPLLMAMCNYVLLSLFLLRTRFGSRRSDSSEPIAVGSRSHSTSSDNEDVNIMVPETYSSANELTASDQNLDVNHNSPKENSLLQIQRGNQSQNQNDQRVAWYWYFGAALLDIEANFLVISAYNYTTITSIMLLDCFTIPCVMILSYFFLGCRYTKKHLIGIFICLFGLGCIFVNDSVDASNGDDENTVNHSVFGDILCLGGAVLYAGSNVMQEYLVKFTSRDHYLGYLGCFGAIIAFIQCMAMELVDISNADFTIGVSFSIIGFVLCLFLMYANTSAFLQSSDATIFNLSLLTSDVYAVIFSYLFYGYLVGWLYFVAYILVIIGLAIYYSERPPITLIREERQDMIRVGSGSGSGSGSGLGSGSGSGSTFNRQDEEEGWGWRLRSYLGLKFGGKTESSSFGRGLGLGLGLEEGDLGISGGFLDDRETLNPIIDQDHTGGSSSNSDSSGSSGSSSRSGGSSSSSSSSSSGDGGGGSFR